MSKQPSEAEAPKILVDPPKKRAKGMPRLGPDGKLWCSKCKKYLTKDHFAKNRTSKDGLHRWCRKCSKAYTKEYLARKRAEAKAAKKESGAKAKAKPK